MSITTEINRLAFAGDGSDNSPYAISFPLRDDDSVEVIYVTDSTGAEVVKTKTTDYTVALAADFVTANLTLVTTAPATGETMVIIRSEPATRLSNYRNFDGQPSATTNSDYDKGTMQDQTLQEQLDRAVLVSKGHPNANLPLTPLLLKGNAGKRIVVNPGETDWELATGSALSGSGTLNTIPLWTPDGDTLGDSVITQSGSVINVAGTLTVTTGNQIAVGVDDTIKGTLTLYGALTTAGGTLVLHVNAADDATINTFEIFPFQDDLYIGPNTDNDSLKYDGGLNTWNITAADFIVTVGAVTIGGVLTISDGNAAAPGIRTTTTAHGMFEKDASTLGFSVAGTEQLTISGTLVVIPLDGLVVSAGNFDVLVGTATIGSDLQVNGTAGIGIARTDGTLHVHTASCGAQSAPAAADDLVVENNASGGMTILTPDAASSEIVFGSPSRQTGAFIDWRFGNLAWQIGTSTAGAKVEIFSGNGVLAMTLNSTQDVEIPSGNVKIGAAGAPAQMLHIKRADAVTMQMLLENTDTSVAYGGGAGLLRMFVSGIEKLRIGATLATFNQGLVDTDFNVRGNSDANLFFVQALPDRVGIGLLAPMAKLHVDQNDAIAAVPVLALDQGDIDDTFINFIGTSAADGTRSISTNVGELGAVSKKVRCEVNGATGWIRIYADHT